jgi:hypothetical protein
MISIYGLADPRDGRVRYVGKANDPARRLKAHLREMRRRTPLYDWIGSLRKVGITPSLRVLEIVHSGDWQEAEKRQIAAHRAAGARLLNIADGGDEPYCDKETRAQNGRKVAATRDPRIWHIKRAMGYAIKAGTLSEESREKLRRAAAMRPDLFGEYANL